MDVGKRSGGMEAKVVSKGRWLNPCGALGVEGSGEFERGLHERMAEEGDGLAGGRRGGG